MQGFGSTTYGDGFADVYDRWYGGITDADATAAFVAARCGDGPVLELGVGTGRLVPALRTAGCAVVGIDASAAMLARCPADLVRVRADLAALPFAPGARFGAALCAFNTLFNLPSPDLQADLLAQVAALLAADGALVVEAISGIGLDEAPTQSVGVSRMTTEELVLSATEVDVGAQVLRGQHVELVDGERVRLRPWMLRWTTPIQLDAMAMAAGLELVERVADWDGTPFTDDHDRHVSVYRPSGG